MREINAEEIKKGDVVLDDGGQSYGGNGNLSGNVSGIRTSGYEVEITIKYKGRADWVKYYPTTKIKIKQTNKF